jgi:hypothetical protein
VSGFTSAIRMAIDKAPRLIANTSTCVGVSDPVGSGRCAVRAITRSMRWSIRWLIAAADAAASQMPMNPASDWRSGGQPGTARNIPMIAVNTIRATTRGLVNSKYWRAIEDIRSGLGIALGVGTVALVPDRVTCRPANATPIDSLFPARRFTTAEGLVKPGSILIPMAGCQGGNGFRLAPE